MISNLTRKTTNYGYEGFPMFRLNSALVRYWIAGGFLRRNLANTIGKTWKTGVVVLNPNLYAIGTVDPRGNPSDLAPPFTQYQMHQVCNKPSVRYNQCACRNFWDPEVQGPWKLRDKERGLDMHHPHCQFEKTSVRGWGQDYQRAIERKRQGLSAQARPDEWNRTREGLLR